MDSICAMCGTSINNIIQYSVFLPDTSELQSSCGRCYTLITIKDKLDTLIEKKGGTYGND